MSRPLGGYFVWEPSRGGPLQLVAGGSGIAPLMAMLRARLQARSDVPVRMLLSWRSGADVIYADELNAVARDATGIEITHTFTRSAPDGWTGRTGRLDREALAELAWTPSERPLAYVCGPTGWDTPLDAAASPSRASVDSMKTTSMQLRIILELADANRATRRWRPVHR